MTVDLLPRHATPLVREALRSSRLVYVQGARQAGKAMVVRQLAQDLGADDTTLDDRGARALAEEVQPLGDRLTMLPVTALWE